MTILVSLYVGRKPNLFVSMSKLIESKLFMCKLFGVTFAIQFCTKDPGTPGTQQQDGDRRPGGLNTTSSDKTE